MGILDEIERQRSILDANARYNSQMAQADQVQSQVKQAPTGLGGILAGIGEKIGDVFSTLSTMGKTALGGAQQQMTEHTRNNIMNDASNARNEIAKRYGFSSYADALSDANADKLSDQFWADIKNANNQTKNDITSLSDDYRNSGLVKDIQNTDLNKAKGQALSTIGTVLDVAPGLGVVGNIASGAVEGIGDAYKNAEGGGQVNLADALTRAAIGAGTAGATGGIASKLGGGKTLLGSVGKSALTGAAGGALSAGATDFAQNQDLGSALGAAVQGAQTGALGGAVMGGANALANKAVNSINQKLNKVPTPEPETTAVKNIADDAASDVADAEAKATGWGDKDMTGSVKKRNALQKFGDTLEDVGQKTQDQSVTGKLKGNLGDKVAEKGSIQKLRDIGFEPSDYEQAANLSEVANKWYDDQVQKSNVKLDMPDTYKLADEIAKRRHLTASETQRLKVDMRERLDAARIVDGKGLNTFDAKGLERVAKGLGQDAEKMTTTNYGGYKKRINNLSSETEAYANALNDIKAELRSKVDDMTDYNANSLRKVLKDAGATPKQIEYITDAKSMAAVKRNTSLLEDARNMYIQMKSSPLKRGANADASTNFTTQAANASGVSGLLNLAAEPIGKVVGRTEKLAGKGVRAIGDAVAGQGGAISGALGNIASKASNLTAGANTDNVISQAVNRAALRNVAQTAGREAEITNNNEQIMNEANQLRQDAETQYTLQQQQLAAQAQQTNPAQEQLNRIANAMTMALNAGDLSAYSQLASLYSQANKIYGAETASTGSQLNATQQGNLAKLRAAGSAIDRLENLYTQAGGGQGRIGGGIAETLAGMGMNSNVSAYNTAARGLINQIAAAVGKTDSLNTEGEVQRALDLVPKITDTAEEAQIKLQSLRQMLEANQQTYNELYGITQ